MITTDAQAQVPSPQPIVDVAFASLSRDFLGAERTGEYPPQRIIASLMWCNAPDYVFY
jgi:hypothetical protein